MTKIRPNARWGNKAVAAVLLASLLLMSFVPHPAEAIPSPQPKAGGGTGIVLRVRLANGSMERIQLEEGSEETLTLGDVLKPLGVTSGASVKIGATTTKSKEKNLKELEIKHGSLITVLPPPKSLSESQPVSRIAARKAAVAREWDPYPDLAKDYESVMLKTKTKRSSGRGMSYSDISKLQSSLHVVDPQKEGPLLRVYMCKFSAERFYSNGVVTAKKKGKPTKQSFESRLGLLLGTIQRERVDRKPKKARTSLSSAPSNSEYCTVAKVQAIWEPPGQKPNNDGKIYDASMATSSFLAKNPRVLAIAKCLGLKPVGWIFSYQDDRLQEENSFKTDSPQALFGLDVAVGGKLKIEAMKEIHDSQQQHKSEGSEAAHDDDDDDDSDRGDRFVTLAMDATTGATEAFQLSDVSVQMVHEDMFRALLEPLEVVVAITDAKAKQPPKIKNPPMAPMKHPVLVDGKETKILDSVLCMVNTGVLSHVGAYSGSSAGSATKKNNGGLTLKTKKQLIRALDSSDSNDFLKEICNFNILLALDEVLAASNKSKTKAKAGIIADDTKALCKLVKKWARGQKKGTVIDSKLRMKLKTCLS